jgi:hypothetical protein
MRTRNDGGAFMSVYRSNFVKFHLLASILYLFHSEPGLAQQPEQPSAKQPEQASDGASGSKSWLVRDPWTGRLFQQQLVNVDVPVTKWEPKTVDQTVFEPQIGTSIQTLPQTLFVPNTQYVLQPKLRGWWNPWKSPVQAYEYVPVTNWVPQTQQLQRAVPTQQWVAKQQKVVIYQPVQSTEVRQQLVQKELPQPAVTPQNAHATQYAGTNPPGQPLIRLPILAQQRGFPGTQAYTSNWQSYGKPAPPWPTAQLSTTQSSAPQWTAPKVPIQYNQSLAYQPVSTQPPMPATRLVLPPSMANILPSGGYRAPLQPSSSKIASRDSLQSGMQATELR